MSLTKIYNCRLPGLKIHQGLIREVGRFTVWQTSCRQTEADIDEPRFLFQNII
jgi:hypothetical protein